MRFFSLSCSVESDEASINKIMSCIQGPEKFSVRQFNVDYSRTTTIQGYVMCTFVKELVPLKYTKNGIILELTLRDVELEQCNKSYFKTRFHNDMALDMNNAVNNLKINTRDIIVLLRPVVRYDASGQWSTLEVGVVDEQAIDVWQHSSNALNKTINPMSVALCVNQQHVKSLRDWKESYSQGSSAGTILSYFIKPVNFWKIEGQVVKGICLCKEVKPNGKAGFFFKITLHKNIAREFHRAIENRTVLFGDMIAFVNPVIFINPAFKSPSILSGEPYFLEIGCRKEEKIVFCKEKTKVQTQTEDSQVDKTVFCKEKTKVRIQTEDSQVEKTVFCKEKTKVRIQTEDSQVDKTVFCKEKTKVRIQTEDSQVEKTVPSSSKTLMADPRTNQTRSSSIEDLPIPSVSIEDSIIKVTDDMCIIPFSLAKPSIDTLHTQNLNLVSGYCHQFCHKMFMYSEILWNVKNEPLCPKCYVILRLCLCLELYALISPSGRLVNVLIAGNKAEKFLKVRCKDFLDDNESRKFVLKALESICVNRIEFKAFKLKGSDVSHVF